jgi:hypothetical protein
MAVNDFRETPVFLYGPGYTLSAVEAPELALYGDLHASKYANKNQDNENSNVKDQSEVNRPSVPFDSALLDKTIVQEDQRQSCKV